MKYTAIGLWEPEVEFIVKAIRAYLILSTKKEDHDRGEIILIKLEGEKDENQNHK